MKRKFNLEKNFPILGAISCIVYVLFKIISLFFAIFINKESVDTLDIIELAIDIMFYMLVAYYFYKYRSRGSSNYAMLMLLITTYLIPFIISVIESAVTLSLYFVSVGILLGLGIAYSIILILNSKKEKKGYRITMLVLGILMVIGGIYGFGVILSGLVDLFIYYEPTTSSIIAYVLSVVDAFISLMFYVLFMLYPIYLKKSSY